MRVMGAAARVAAGVAAAAMAVGLTGCVVPSPAEAWRAIVDVSMPAGPGSGDARKAPGDAGGNGGGESPEGEQPGQGRERRRETRSRQATANDKLAFYVTGGPGEELASVIALSWPDGSPIDPTQLVSTLDADGVPWYQVIVGRSTAPQARGNDAHVYLASGLSREDVMRAVDSLARAGYVATPMTPADYDGYRSEQPSLYYLETCVLSPQAG